MNKDAINYIARQLIRSCTKGYFATILDVKNEKNKDVFKKNLPIPYSTFTMLACDYDGNPLLLLSDLSEHTKNLKKNKITSILLSEEQQFKNYFPIYKNKIRFSQNYQDPMSRPRITLIGEIIKDTRKSSRLRFLNRHPSSNLYAGFKDMNIYKLQIISGHLIGGFAQVKWFSKGELICKSDDSFMEDEEMIMQHMNQEHQKSINLYAKAFLGYKGKKNWCITGIDSEGFDMRLSGKVMRINFDESLVNSKKLRKFFVTLHKRAEKKVS